MLWLSKSKERKTLKTERNGAIMSPNKQEKVADVANSNWRKRCDNEVQSKKALQHVQPTPIGPINTDKNNHDAFTLSINGIHYYIILSTFPTFQKPHHKVSNFSFGKSSIHTSGVCKKFF